MSRRETHKVDIYETVESRPATFFNKLEEEKEEKTKSSINDSNMVQESR
jgi:hypothetical protein